MGDLPPNPTHHPLPPNPTIGDTADRRSPARQMDPPGNERARDPREEFPRGFTRGGFAPIPHRHADAPAASSEPERHRSPPPPPRVYDREFERERDLPRRQEGRDREFPRRDLDPEPERDGRSWNTYYDRSGRGGPPPPQWDDDYDRPKRRRSPSPYDQAARTRFRSPTPPRYPTAVPSGLPDPAEVDYVLSFRQFSEWFRTSHPQTAKTDDEETRRVRSELESGAGGDTGKEKVGMAKRYDRYRKEYTSRQLYGLFLAHGQTAWFQERYSHEPQYIAMRKRLCRQGRVPTVETYIAEVREGKWDNVGYDMTEDTTNAGPSIRRLEDSQSEGLDRALGDFPAQDNANRAEAPAQRGQIFVKTVPPSTKRADLEEMFSQIKGFLHLAITEPSLKKQFYRVAWAQFTEDTDLEDVLRRLNNTKIDTFTFHLGINTTPVIGRIRMTVPYASATERVLKDIEKAKALALKLEDDLVEPESETSEETKPETSLDKPVKALSERGSVVVEETISRLLEKHDLTAETLSDEEANVKVKLVLDQWLSYLRNGLSTCYYCVAPSAFPEELQRKCILHLRPQYTPGSSDEIASEQQDQKPEGLDEDADNRYEGGDRDVQVNQGQGKSKTAFPQKTGDERWELSLDHKLEPLLGPVDVVEYGGRDLQEESKKVAAPHIRQEEATKYRCKECNKLFKAPEFVVKHVIVKHSELIGDKLDEIATLNNFVLDPQHIQPTASTPAAINDTLPISMLDPASTVHLNPAMANADMSGGNVMMQQQMMMMLQMQQAMMMGQMQFPQQQMGQQAVGTEGAGMGQGGQDLLQRVGGYASRDANLGPLPAAPAGGEDPRAKRGRVSYQDLDQPGGAGDGGLPY